MLSSSKRLHNFLILFFHSETNLKEHLGQLGVDPRPLGLGAPQPGPLHHRANCWTARLFSFYLIGFFHSETNVKELAAQPGIDPRPVGFEHHSDFSILPNPFLSLLSQLTLRLFKRLGAQGRNRFSLLIGFEHHSLDHYTTMNVTLKMKMTLYLSLLYLLLTLLF